MLVSVTYLHIAFKSGSSGFMAAQHATDLAGGGPGGGLAGNRDASRGLSFQSFDGTPHNRRHGADQWPGYATAAQNPGKHGSATHQVLHDAS
jgi:hypothetical protein